MDHKTSFFIYIIISVLCALCSACVNAFTSTTGVETIEYGDLDAIIPQPVRREYSVGSQFVPAGLRVFAVYDSGVTKQVPLEDVTITPDGVNDAGEFVSLGVKYVTIEYREKTADFTVNVVEYATPDLPEEGHPPITDNTSINIVINWQ
jgi:hypothetical protein